MTYESNANGNMTNNFTTRIALKILAVICLICVFCPAFLVSCSGEKMEIGVMNVAMGITLEGTELEPAHPVAIAMLFIPILALIYLFMKKAAEKFVASATMTAMILDLIAWVVFKSSVQKYAEENYCSVETTVFYWINFLAILLMILLTGLVLGNILQLDRGLFVGSGYPGSGGYPGPGGHAGPGGYPGTGEYRGTGEKAKKFCMECGTENQITSRFCKRCGKPLC